MKTDNPRKAKRLVLAMAGLLAAGGLWFARPALRAPASEKAGMAAGVPTPEGQSPPGGTPNQPARLAPPDPARVFMDFTPEQRVEFARRGHGPGG